MISSYGNKKLSPKVTDYKSFCIPIPKDIDSPKRKCKIDNYFYDTFKKKHYLIELKSGGDLDIKKARAEKTSLLEQYFLLKNKLNSNDEEIKIFLATAYNRYGEGNEWKQGRVLQFFAKEELLIGKDYWNFCCGTESGFDIIFGQYKKNIKKIKEKLNKIKSIYI